MPVIINGTTGITTPTYNGNVAAEYLVPVTSFKNRIINGAMTIDQRNAGASVNTTSASTPVYTVDRWYYFASQTSKFTVQQNGGAVTPPAGFNNYLGITSSSAYTVGSSELFSISQSIEGFNVGDLGWGTANAKTVTLSFWVRSSLTGTFGGAVTNSSQNRSYPFTYTINSANTWEYETITITGDTTGTWLTTNGVGMTIWFGVGVGSNFLGTDGAWVGATRYSATGATSVVGTSGATFYITGVQLEVGSSATSFDYRPYANELQLCYRYYFTSNNKIGGGGGSAAFAGWSGYTDDAYAYVCSGFTFPVDMRAAPTITVFSGSGNGYVDGFGRGQYGGGFAGATSDAIMTYCVNYVSARAGGGSNNFATGSIMRGGYIASAEL